MIIWNEPLTVDRQKKIEEFINNLEEEIKNETYNFPKSIGTGQFAECYEVEGVIIKRTHRDAFFLDDNWNETLQVELELISDHFVMRELKELKSIPILYGYSDCLHDSYTIMEKAKGTHLESLLLQGNPLTQEMEKSILEGLESIIKGGYYPQDLVMEDIYISDQNIMFIDFNLFQSMEYLMLENANLDFTKSNLKLAEEYWKNLKKWGLDWINTMLKLA